MESDADRDLFFRRFSAYRSFAKAYRCPLDTNAELAEERVVNLAPGRAIRFVRLNSALVCSNREDEQGKLLLGARQRVLNQRPGEELVVLSHHPVRWFQDSEDALRYIRSRARIFISGHEHHPSVRTISVKEGSDLMLLAAGATVPPNSNDTFTYCYNFIEFDWNADADALSVYIRPRAWIDKEKRFGAGDVRLGCGESKFILGSPNFRNAPEDIVVDSASDIVLIPMPDARSPDVRNETVSDTYPLLLLRFFRDISPAQRVSILASFGALPPNWTGTLSESSERESP